MAIVFSPCVLERADLGLLLKYIWPSKERIAMSQTVKLQTLDEPTDVNGVSPSANRLLAAMPDADFKRWEPHLKLVDLTLGQVISEPRCELE